MGFSDFFKISDYLKQIEDQKEEICRLNKIIDSIGLDLANDIYSCNLKLSELERTILSKEQELALMEARSNNLSSEISDKQSKIFSLDEKILVESFGLYEPRFKFASSLEFKESLAYVRNKQKELIKSFRAATGNINWTVNGSPSKGQKMIKDMQKLILRAFNSECDDLVEKVKYSNFDASLKKLYSTAESISKLGASSTGIRITSEYIDLKAKELRLAFEYQLKKQEEKDALREARAQERENARLQKELEEQRKAIYKEQHHYEHALSAIEKQLSVAPDNPDLLAKKESIERELSSIEKSLIDIDYRAANQKAGYVYIISNIGAFGDNVYKIGMTRRLDPQERVDELGDASVPFNFDVHAMIFSEDAPALEASLHKAFEHKKLNMVNTRREFFNVTLDEIKEVVKKNFDKTVEFTDFADATQYRISQKLKSGEIKKL